MNKMYLYKIVLAAAALIIAPRAMMAEDKIYADSLSMKTSMTDWVDPVHATPVRTHYVTYPTPSRGVDTEGSCLVYLPECYEENMKEHYPVIYYLHGGTGNQREAVWLIERIDNAINEEKMDPVIVVSPQALPIGWYVNANPDDDKVLSGPIQDVIIKDLIPYIDNNYLTIAAPEGRGIEGFSMGGRGALALAFSFPDIFGAVSSIAGAVVDWEEEPLQRALECTFGNMTDPFSIIYFNAWHPLTAACRNSRIINDSGMKVRMYVGTKDRLYDENGNHITQRFHESLNRLGIHHTYTEVEGADHNPLEIFNDDVNPYDVIFWQDAFTSARLKAALPEGIKTFLTTHFSGSHVVTADIIPEEKGDHYVVTLSDGIELKFNEHSNWILVNCLTPEANIPTSMIHDGITTYIHQHDIAASIRRIEKVPRVGYDVTFSDGTSLVFNTKGELCPEPQPTLPQ